MEEILLQIKLLKDRLVKEQKISAADLLDVLSKLANELENKVDKKTR